MKSINRYKVLLTEKEIDRINDCITSGNLVTGDDILQFEKEISNLFNKKYCICVANGFAALHLSLNALGFKNKGIIVPALSTCYAILNSIRASGNYPVYCEVHPDSGNLDIKYCSRLLTKETIGCILSPNYFGIPSDIDSLKEYGLPVIEDSAQSFLTNSERISNSDLTVCSFYPTKMINAIDGGAIVTDNKEYYDYIRDSRYYDNQNSDDQILRYNYRMENLHAALGLSSLGKLEILKKRVRNITEKYIKIFNGFENVNYLASTLLGGFYYQKFIVKFSNKNDTDAFINETMNKNIDCTREFVPPFCADTFINSYNLYNNTCSIPFYESLTDDDVEYICDQVRSILIKIGV